eukprot:1050096_1
MYILTERMSSVWLIIISMIVSAHLTICLSTTIDTTTVDQYKQKAIHCPEGEDCTIICDETEACFGSYIYCPTNHACDIQCLVHYPSTFRVCESARIFCTNSTQCDVSCWDPLTHHPLYLTYGCKDATMFWPDNKQYSLNCGDGASCWGVDIDAPYDDQPLTVECGMNECPGITINCPDNSICTVQCETTQSCQTAVINCGSGANAECYVHCDGVRGCKHLVVTGSGILTGCSGTHSCSDATFPQPPSNTDYSLTCGSGTLLQYACENAKIKCPSNAECHVICNGNHGCDNATIIWPTEGIHATSLTCGANACQNGQMPPSQPPTSVTTDPSASPTVFPSPVPTYPTYAPQNNDKVDGFDLLDPKTFYILIGLSVAVCCCSCFNVFLFFKPKKREGVNVAEQDSGAGEYKDPALSKVFSIPPVLPNLPKSLSLMFWEKEGVPQGSNERQVINNMIANGNQMMENIAEEDDLETPRGAGGGFKNDDAIELMGNSVRDSDDSGNESDVIDTI